MKPRSRPSRNRGRSDTREEVGNSPTAAPIRPCETFKPEQIPLEQLLEAQWNANRVPPRLLAKVRRSIVEFGVIENLVARPHPDLPGKFEVLSGNHRLRVLRELGHETAPVVVVELGDAEPRLLAQTLNRTRGSDDPRATRCCWRRCWRELLLKVRSYKPDVAIVDIKMPPTQTDEGLRAAKEIREQYPDTAVLVLSQYVEEGYALELLQGSAEGVGYLLKDRVYDLADFVAAVKRVAAGGSALDPSVVSQLVGRRRSDDPLDTLSAREREVLELMAEGLSNSAIAARVFLTERGVEKHVTSIFQKLRLPVAADTHRRVLAVVAFLQS
jgi:DNA-binding NarL/FixJ family response regulator